MKDLAPRETPLPAVSAETSHLRFNEADPADMLACELITERYVGIEVPLIVFSRDGYRTLVVPRTVRRKEYEKLARLRMGRAVK